MPRGRVPQRQERLPRSTGRQPRRRYAVQATVERLNISCMGRSMMQRLFDGESLEAAQPAPP